MKNVSEIIKNAIIEKLNDYKGITIYACDLAYKLFETENCNGSVHCSRYKATEFIKVNFDAFGQLVEYYEENMDMVLNPFLYPEKSEVIMYIEGASSMLSQCQIIEKNWNEEIELNGITIKKLTKQLKNKEISF